jgi:hypothetical protein
MRAIPLALWLRANHSRYLGIAAGEGLGQAAAHDTLLLTAAG